MFFVHYNMKAPPIVPFTLAIFIYELYPWDQRYIIHVIIQFAFIIFEVLYHERKGTKLYHTFKAKV